MIKCQISLKDKGTYLTDRQTKRKNNDAESKKDIQTDRHKDIGRTIARVREKMKKKEITVIKRGCANAVIQASGFKLQQPAQPVAQLLTYFSPTFPSSHLMCCCLSTPYTNDVVIPPHNMHCRCKA